MSISAGFSPDGKFVVTASWDGTARLWETASGKAIGEPLRHEREVANARFSPDGKFVVTASGDRTARLWETASGKARIESLCAMRGRSLALGFSPDGKFACSRRVQPTTQAVGPASSKAVGEPLGHERGVVPLDSVRMGNLWIYRSEVGGSSSCTLFAPLSVSAGQAGRRYRANHFPKNCAGRRNRAWIPQKTPIVTSQLIESFDWFAAPSRTRSISPGSSRRPQFIIREIQDARRFRADRKQAKSILDKAYRIDPAHPLIHLALAMVEDDEQTAAFLRDFDLKRLPESCAYSKDLDPKEVL